MSDDPITLARRDAQLDVDTIAPGAPQHERGRRVLAAIEALERQRDEAKARHSDGVTAVQQHYEAECARLAREAEVKREGFDVAAKAAAALEAEVARLTREVEEVRKDRDRLDGVASREIGRLHADLDAAHAENEVQSRALANVAAGLDVLAVTRIAEQAQEERDAARAERDEWQAEFRAARVDADDARWLARQHADERDTLRAEVASLKTMHADAIRTALAAKRDAREARAKVARLRGAAGRLADVIESAGLINLSNGVQLGQTSWFVKASDALSDLRAALSTTPGAAGEGGASEAKPLCAACDHPEDEHTDRNRGCCYGEAGLYCPCIAFVPPSTSSDGAPGATTEIVTVGLRDVRPYLVAGDHVHTCPECHEHERCEETCVCEVDMDLDDGTKRGAHIVCATCGPRPPSPEPSPSTAGPPAPPDPSTPDPSSTIVSSSEEAGRVCGDGVGGEVPPTCAQCGRTRPGVTVATFVCRYCLSLDVTNDVTDDEYATRLEREARRVRAVVDARDAEEMVPAAPPSTSSDGAPGADEYDEMYDDNALCECGHRAGEHDVERRCEYVGCHCMRRGFRAARPSSLSPAGPPAPPDPSTPDPSSTIVSSSEEAGRVCGDGVGGEAVTFLVDVSLSSEATLTVDHAMRALFGSCTAHLVGGTVRTSNPRRAPSVSWEWNDDGVPVAVGTSTREPPPLTDAQVDRVLLAMGDDMRAGLYGTPPPTGSTRGADTAVDDIEGVIGEGAIDEAARLRVVVDAARAYRDAHEAMARAPTKPAHNAQERAVLFSTRFCLFRDLESLVGPPPSTPDRAPPSLVGAVRAIADDLRAVPLAGERGAVTERDAVAVTLAAGDVERLLAALDSLTDTDGGGA